MVVEASGLDHSHHDHQKSLCLRALEEPTRLNPMQGGQVKVSGERVESDQRKGGTHRPPASFRAGAPSPQGRGVPGGGEAVERLQVWERDRVTQ